MEYLCLHTSVRAGLNQYGHDAYTAIVSELKQLIVDKEAMHPVRRGALTNTEAVNVIRSHMFLKAKFDAQGVFEKIKARLVANGAQQDKKLYDNTSSPTAKLQSVMMVLVLAAQQRRRVTCVDIGGAYLNAPMEGESVIMELDPMLTKFALEIKPDLKPFVDQRGKLLVKLDKALYGCVQSARLWYDTLTKFLKSKGFVHNEVDPCVMNKGRGVNQVTIVIYVDDILISAKNQCDIDRLIGELKTEYREVKTTDQTDFSYLGMHIRATHGRVEVSMQAYTEGVLAENEVSGSVTTPATGNLFKIGDSPRLSDRDAEKFHTTVAKLLYLAKRTRPDILLSVAFLTTRVKEPTQEDKNKLARVLKYLNGNCGRKLIFRPSTASGIIGYIDASFGLHDDGRSHTGLIVTLYGCNVLCESSKQKIVSRDSTEAELIGLSDKMMKVLECHEFIIQQGIQIGMPIVMQDNNSTITLVTKGGGKYRTKHLKARQAQVKELIDHKLMVVNFLSTRDMLADPLSKPLQGELFRYLTSSTFGEKRAMSQGRVDGYGPSVSRTDVRYPPSRSANSE